ncbi:GREB1-related protein [Brachybacterium tyrofermentans]|uniref:GREB1-related protein n=1 Tax=Brachybacterium tyrofermentans TaxID=47848 RepID=UPI0018683FC3|nr:hypothetical protein [Brachybacterium tyrofermentans]
MYATSAEQRAGIMVAVITGGRPALKDRPTRRFLPQLQAAGLGDICWMVSDHEAATYERDEHELVPYSREWAVDYARDHWMRPEPVNEGAFLGAFTGREAACLEAERRGYWGVLQLDDNVIRLALSLSSRSSAAVVKDYGGLGWFADLSAAVILGTNARTAGPQLMSVVDKTAPRLARPGFPYSVFIEQVGEGREPWWGPYEDDITHSFQYGDRADGATAAVLPRITYAKEGKSNTGMRAKYDHTRSQQLQRLLPQGAKVGVRKSKSNGMGGPRVFHTMTSGAIRNPVRVKDPELIQRAADSLQAAHIDFHALEKHNNRIKVREAAAKLRAAS